MDQCRSNIESLGPPANPVTLPPMVHDNVFSTRPIKRMPVNADRRLGQ